MSTVLDPGSLKTRVGLFSQESLPDGHGGHEQQWNLVGEFNVRLEPVAGFSRTLARTLESGITHQVTMRSRPDVRVSMELRSQGRRFEIATMRDPDETGRYWLLDCREVQQV
ncbi:MAG: phage head closure protein [Nitratireductor sp.]|nr:phage head closure protein [Nitratireductor sp.]MCB1459270.1 phage head closure protein [Nitratireductor sp.]